MKTMRSIAQLVAVATLVAMLGAALPAQAQEQEELEAADLSGNHVAVLVGQDFQDAEALMPMAYLANRGAEVTVIGVEPAVHQAYNSDIKVRVQQSVTEVSVDDFDALIIPGGGSPEWLRQHDSAVDFVREFTETGKLVAAICHGPQLLVTAGVLDGVHATCVGGVSDELVEAGAEYADEPVLVDGNIITSRVPDDIPVWNATIEEALAEQN
ncbi:MAG: type 1 glutamine amidotransferase domain-containing protein [Candidatus Hydrogenedentota bacterium]